jgi:hypothetical protein
MFRLESNHGNGAVGAAWDAEIERRIEVINAGMAKGRTFADVLRDIDRKLASSLQS